MAEFGVDPVARHRRHFRRIGVVALVVGMVGMAALIVVLHMIDARLGRIEPDGQSVSADVVATDGRGEGGTITIEFRSPTGARTEVVRLDGGSPDYEVGQRLDVKVMGTDPAEFAVPGEQNLSGRTSSILIWGFVLFACGCTTSRPCRGNPTVSVVWSRHERANRRARP